ncbi:MAG: hypothetical protein HY940_00075 [Gammaproteobacteria bacterium]|nr:hypothetical protein [Gammaproteobacteria bacterium]
MKPPVVIIGIGQLASVFAHGLLRSGHAVYPVNRGVTMHEMAQQIPRPALTLVAVAEGDLHSVLDGIPAPWRTRMALLQNELLPRDWQQHRITDPTVIAVWFEKKRGLDARPILPTPVFGPAATMIQQALQAIDISSRVIPDEDALLFELVRKNLYILTINIAGIITGGTVRELWDQHHALTLQVASEIIAVQQWLTGRVLPASQLIDGMIEAFDGDPQHLCMGRSALSRLQRALQHADAAGLAAPTLRGIAAQGSTA